MDGAPAAAGRIVVAMSGGVDSTVTAGLLAAAGYDVVGVTLQLYDHGAAVSRKGACCAGQDIHDAKAAAEQLGIPHYVLNYERRFQTSVMDRFADSYARGETPIPCVLCNQTVKFTDLLETARDLGASALATGHYAQRVRGADGVEMRRGEDLSRDQSYFLFATTPEQLEFLRFPLGGLRKSEVRAAAEALGLAVADKPDSQDICFVPTGGYADVIEKLRPGAGRPGDILHVDGRKLGRHAGVIHYTIGQRRGLGLATGEPLFVTAIDAARDAVIVGPREALAVKRFALRDVNWLSEPPVLGDARPANVKVRSTRPPAPAMIREGNDGAWTVELATAEEGVAPGQACVFYDGATDDRRVLGGGWIVSAERAGAGAGERIAEAVSP
ncbi:MAG: tRNA 2-thiouridine(34) synthase MnmA [Pseudomonadota bacterium]